MSFAPVIINLQTFKVNSLDNGSVLNIGDSQHIDLFVSYKRNQGIGEQNGDCSPMYLPASAVIDSDLNDNNAIKNSIV